MRGAKEAGVSSQPTEPYSFSGFFFPQLVQVNMRRSMCCLTAAVVASAHQAALHFVFKSAIICTNNMPHNNMAIQRRPPARMIKDAFAASARRACNAMAPEVPRQPSTRMSPACTKRRHRVGCVSNVFMLNLTGQLPNCHTNFRHYNRFSIEVLLPIRTPLWWRIKAGLVRVARRELLFGRSWFLL